MKIKHHETVPGKGISKLKCHKEKMVYSIYFSVKVFISGS